MNGWLDACISAWCSATTKSRFLSRKFCVLYDTCKPNPVGRRRVRNEDTVVVILPRLHERTILQPHVPLQGL